MGTREKRDLHEKQNGCSTEEGVREGGPNSGQKVNIRGEGLKTVKKGYEGERRISRGDYY